MKGSRNMKTYKKKLVAAAIGLSASGLASAASFDFTGNGGSADFGNSVIEVSDDGLITATITASRHGATSGVSGFDLDGYGVADGGYRSIQGNEMITISFSQAVDISTLHLRQWEGPDEANAVVSFNGGSATTVISADTGGWFDTNEYVMLVGAEGVTSMTINGIYNGSIFGIESTQFFVAGLQGVEASEVPVPAAAWMFGSALIGLATIGRRRKL